jgi:hypothetical protein
VYEWEYLYVVEQFLFADDGSVVDFRHQPCCEYQSEFLLDLIYVFEVVDESVLVVVPILFIALD